MGFIQHQVPPLYRRRTFSDKFTDTTDFITANWRVLLRMLTIVLLPLCLLQALNVNTLMSSMYGDMVGNGDVSDTLVGFAINYGALMVFGIIATVLFICIVYTLMQLYHEQNADGTPAHPNLNSITFAQFRPLMMRQVRSACKAIGAFLLFFVVLMVFMVVAAVVFAAMTTSLGSNEAGVVLVVIFVYAIVLMLLPPIAMVVPVFSFEKIGFWAGLKKSLVYGFKTWRGVVAVTIVVGLMVGMVLGVLGLPFIMMTMFKALFAVQNSGEYTFTNSVWYSFLQYLSAIVYVYASYLGYAVMLVARAYQYGHAREKIDGDDFFDNANGDD